MSRNITPEIEVTPAPQNADLDQLIEKRKLEKCKVLKEKLQQKRRIIQDRRKVGGNNEPFPEGAFERFRSNNIWEVVLECLADPTDISSVYFVCRTFAEILEKRRILLLLPKVLEIFKNKVDLAYEDEGKEIAHTCYKNWDGICTSARGVCKAWKEIVDFHSNTARDSWFPSSSDRYNYEEDYNTKYFFVLEDEQSVDKATSSVISRGLTVSPIRDVIVVVGDRSPEPYYRRLMEYLKAHGRSVRFLRIEYNSSPGNITPAAREKLYNILRPLEGLMGLEIEFVDNATDVFQPQYLQRGLNHFPVLRSLEHLTLYGWKEKESLVVPVLKECVHLRTLDLGRDEPAENETVEALRGLTLEGFKGLSSIITSHQFLWPLKHLKVYWVVDNDLDASVIFPAINHFRNTLEHLHIQDRVLIDDRSRNVRLDLPLLETFRVDEILSGRMGLDSLLPLISLERLYVDHFAHEEENSEVKIKRYLDLGEMDRSNVWQCFPYLIHLKINSKVFKRP